MALKDLKGAMMYRCTVLLSCLLFIIITSCAGPKTNLNYEPTESNVRYVSLETPGIEFNEEPNDSFSDQYILYESCMSSGMAILENTFMRNSDIMLMNINDEQMRFNINGMDLHEIIPLNQQGEFQISMYECDHDDFYYPLDDLNLEVNLDDSMVPFLRPNYYVDYYHHDIVQLSKEIIHDGMTEEEAIQALYDHFVNNFEYDHTVPDNTLLFSPNLTEVETQKQGICVELASLFCAYCRVWNVPAKLIFGDCDGEYHAWCEIYASYDYSINGLQLHANQWNRIDITMSVTTHGNEDEDWIQDDSNYTIKHTY